MGVRGNFPMRPKPRSSPLVVRISTVTLPIRNRVATFVIFVLFTVFPYYQPSSMFIMDHSELRFYAGKKHFS